MCWSPHKTSTLSMHVQWRRTFAPFRRPPHDRGTARNFQSYLGADHPEVQRLHQLRREPHILGWMSRLRSQTPALTTASYINLLGALRGICNELVWTEQLPELAHLIRREDIPRLPQRLPRPLTT